MSEELGKIRRGKAVMGSVISLLKHLKDLTYVTLLVMLIALIGSNWLEVDDFIKRVLRSAEQVSIGSITVSVEKNGKTENGMWAAYYRVSDTLRVINAAFSDKRTRAEYIEVQALSPVNLSRGYIGDGDEMLFLGDSELNLRRNEIIRIYTFVSAEKEQCIECFLRSVRERLGRKVVVAKNIAVKDKESEKKGIFKGDPGEGDRIVILDWEKMIRLDLDYWWVRPPENMVE